MEESSADESIDVIDNFEAVRLLINIYLIKKVKSLNRPVNQEKFIDNVRKEFRSKGYNYLRRRILYTWKYLLDTYQYYKGNYTADEGRKLWVYFDLMDNCFDESEQTSEKFKDARCTFSLIESLSKHKQMVLTHGLTMDILQAVEDDLRASGNYNITQKDIYNQWIFLKRFYRQNQKTGYYKQVTKNHAYFTALKNFFEPEEIKREECGLQTQNVSENELFTAIESIRGTEDDTTNIKRQKIDHTEISPKENNTFKENFSIENIYSASVPFTTTMHNILLQYVKKNKTKIQAYSNLNEDIVNEILENFQKLGYTVTRQSILNEWNDLSCRYDLIKNTEHPEKWPYFKDMKYIYSPSNINESSSLVDQQDNESTIGSIVMENLRKNHSINHKDYMELTERLLNIYESNSKEFLEIKDILVERNLLREETNYLLNILVEKFSKKKQSS